MESGKNGEQESSKHLPPVGKGVFVENLGKHRFAYRDAQGLWRDYYTGDILQGEVIYDHYD